jgi:hypothetical protein
MIALRTVFPSLLHFYRGQAREESADVERADAVEIYELYARVCKAIADGKRLLIINELRDGPRTVGELVDALDIPQANASQHLAVLRDRESLRRAARGAASITR